MARKAAAALLCLAAAVADAPLSAAVEPTNARSEGIIPAGAMPEQPLPYTEAATGELHKADMQIHGVKITFAVRSWQHLGLLKEHVSREVNGYAIVKDAIESAQKKDPSKRPLLMDVGSNHGLYSLFAAKLGADVITLEPQERLCRVINKAALLNGKEVAQRITLYHAAALDHREVITMSAAEVAEGAVATVVRAGKSGGGSEKTPAYPISDFISSDEKRPICFLKIDVEGFELHAIPSANTLFSDSRVDNVLVEFGPPSRWKHAAGDSSKVGTQLLDEMQTKYHFENRVIDSLCWDTFLRTVPRETRHLAQKSKIVRVANETLRNDLIQAMSASNEAYVWFVRHKSHTFPTFAADCGGRHGERQSTKPETKGMSLFGCDADQ